EQGEPASTGAIAAAATNARDGGSGEARPGAARSILPAVVSAARLSGDASRTRLSFELTRNIEIRAFALADPYRVIV
ncbi:hypothetical protein, partial [Proteus vulgaris]|uniref:hypothetical protein n=1 Tax=Proteus vulgaris TaxID=585 RepID=UPI001954279D